MKLKELLDMIYKVDNDGIVFIWQDRERSIWEMKEILYDLINDSYSLKKEIEIFEKQEKLNKFEENLILNAKMRLKENIKNIDEIKNMEIYTDADVYDETLEDM